MINGQIKEDMKDFLRNGWGCAWKPDKENSCKYPDALATAGLAEWSKTSGWARDTGG